MAMKYTMIKDQLKGEYLAACDKVELYADLKHIDWEVQSEKLMDLLDLLLQAQYEGKPVSDIVGTDLDRFCKNYFADYSAGDRLREFLKRIKRIAWMLFILEGLWMFASLGEADFHFFTNTTDISGYVGGLLMGGVVLEFVNALLRLCLFRVKRFTVNMNLFLETVTLIGGLILIFRFWGDRKIYILTWPLLLGSGAYLLGYYTLQWYRRYQTTGSIKEVKSDYEISFGEMVKVEYDQNFGEEMVKALAKRFRRMNRRRKRRGKAEYTSEEFFEKLKREDAISRRAVPAIFIGVVVCSTIFTAQDSTLWDTVIWFAIISVCEFVVYRFYSKIEKSGVRERNAIWQECRKRDMTLLEYEAFRQEASK